MFKSTVESRIRAVPLYEEQVKSAKEICQAVGVSRRTLWRWIRAYWNGGMEHVSPKKMEPKHRMPNGISKTLEDRTLTSAQAEASFLGSQESRVSVQCAVRLLGQFTTSSNATACCRDESVSDRISMASRKEIRALPKDRAPP